MHEITPSLNTVSLVHGVETASGADSAATTEDEGSIASVYSSVDNPSVNPGDLTNTKLDSISHNNEVVVDAVPDDKMSTETSRGFSATVTTPSSTFTTETTNNNSETVSTVISTSTTPISTSTAETVKNVIDNSNRNTKLNYSIDKNDSRIIEQPPPDIITEKSITPKKENKREGIAYDPDSMQGDSFSSLYSYGVQKLQYLKLLAKLNEVSEELHIDLDEPTEEKEREKLHYDSGSQTVTTNTTTPSTTLTSGFPITPKEIPITSKSTEEILVTTHQFVAPTKHDILTTRPPSETNTNPVNMTTSPIPSIIKDATVNMATESKTPDFTNAKHVMINLTISTDNTENSYKPLYSLTVKVPTVGDSNEIPTIKITPLDAEPTLPTNFNKPIPVEGVSKAIKDVNTVTDWGGSCECSCPSCSNTESADDFYNDDYGSSTTNIFDSTDTVTSSTDISSSTEGSSTIEYPTESEVTESTLITEDYLTSSTTDLTTETGTESFSTTESPKFVCPKIKPPPILILEGEVTKYDIDDNLLTFTEFIG